jgi:hypothetical protein
VQYIHANKPSPDFYIVLNSVRLPSTYRLGAFNFYKLFDHLLAKTQAVRDTVCYYVLVIIFQHPDNEPVEGAAAIGPENDHEQPDSFSSR